MPLWKHPGTVCKDLIAASKSNPSWQDLARRTKARARFFSIIYIYIYVISDVYVISCYISDVCVILCYCILIYFVYFCFDCLILFVQYNFQFLVIMFLMLFKDVHIHFLVSCYIFLVLQKFLTTTQAVDEIAFLSASKSTWLLGELHVAAAHWKPDELQTESDAVRLPTDAAARVVQVLPGPHASIEEASDSVPWCEQLVEKKQIVLRLCCMPMYGCFRSKCFDLNVSNIHLLL